METIKELYNEGKISARTYNVLRRGITSLIGDDVPSRNEFEGMTVREIFVRIGEDHIMSLRNVGPATMKELKGLL